MSGKTIEQYDAENQQRALAFIKTVEEVSISMMQRKMRWGYNRAARTMEWLIEEGHVIKTDGFSPNKVTPPKELKG